MARKLVWREIGVIEIDGGMCAFADASVDRNALSDAVSEHIGELSSKERSLDLSEYGFAAVACLTMVDVPLPVEVLAGDTGSLLGVRMCFTDDVDDLGGTWRPIGELRIASGNCMALDPSGSEDAHRLIFELPSGDYSAEVFDFTDEDGSYDCLGLRLRALTAE